MLSTPTFATSDNDDELPHLTRLTESGIREFYTQVKVQRPPAERSPLAERLWPFKPKPVELDD